MSINAAIFAHATWAKGRQGTYPVLLVCINWYSCSTMSTVWVLALGNTSPANTAGFAAQQRLFSPSVHGLSTLAACHLDKCNMVCIGAEQAELQYACCNVNTCRLHLQLQSFQPLHETTGYQAATHSVDNVHVCSLPGQTAATS
jgi:hypothetical protein